MNRLKLTYILAAGLITWGISPVGLYAIPDNLQALTKHTSSNAPDAAASSKKKKKKKQKGEEKESGNKVQEYYDVYSVGGDDWTPAYNPEIHKANLKELAGIQQSDQKVIVDSLADTQTSENAVKEARGFRVQLINVLDEGKANDIKSEAQKSFDDVYIIFQSPNYKVRVGNFRSRSEADQAVEEAKKLGFRDAWVVPSKIELKK